MIKEGMVYEVSESSIYLINIKDIEKTKGTSSKFWNVKSRMFPVANPENFSLKKGDFVEYLLPRSKTIMASFTTLILPILVFFISYIGIYLVAPQLEKINILLPIALMGLSLAVKRKDSTLPKIVTKITKEDIAQKKNNFSSCGSCSSCG